MNYARTSSLIILNSQKRNYFICLSIRKLAENYIFHIFGHFSVTNCYFELKTSIVTLNLATIETMKSGLIIPQIKKEINNTINMDNKFEVKKDKRKQNFNKVVIIAIVVIIVIATIVTVVVLQSDETKGNYTENNKKVDETTITITQTQSYKLTNSKFKFSNLRDFLKLFVSFNSATNNQSIKFMTRFETYYFKPPLAPLPQLNLES